MRLDVCCTCNSYIISSWLILSPSQSHFHVLPSETPTGWRWRRTTPGCSVRPQSSSSTPSPTDASSCSWCACRASGRRRPCCASSSTPWRSSTHKLRGSWPSTTCWSCPDDAPPHRTYVRTLPVVLFDDPQTQHRLVSDTERLFWSRLQQTSRLTSVTVTYVKIFI